MRPRSATVRKQSQIRTNLVHLQHNSRKHLELLPLLLPVLRDYYTTSVVAAYNGEKETVSKHL